MNVIGSIPTANVTKRAFRLANQTAVSSFLQEPGLDRESAKEMRDLLPSYALSDSLEELCDAPFRPKPGLRKRGLATRFPNGSFPVFYSSLEAETAKSEVQHWFPKLVGKPVKPRTAYYLCFACEFEGSTMDLRPRQVDWSDLTDKRDCKFCNSLGGEAVRIRLDALLASSARRIGGTNLPVFARKSICDPQVLVHLAATFDPSTGYVSMSSSQESSG